MRGEMKIILAIEIIGKGEGVDVEQICVGVADVVKDQLELHPKVSSFSVEMYAKVEKEVVIE